MKFSLTLNIKYTQKIFVELIITVTYQIHKKDYKERNLDYIRK